MSRLAFCFHNPNHAAALICALLPLCWGWRRAWWAGRALSAALLVALLLTQSRTGVLVAGVEAMAWWWISRIGTAVSSRPPYRRWFPWILGGMIRWCMAPRLAFDGAKMPELWQTPPSGIRP